MKLLKVNDASADVHRGEGKHWTTPLWCQLVGRAHHAAMIGCMHGLTSRAASYTQLLWPFTTKTELLPQLPLSPTQFLLLLALIVVACE